MENIKSHTNGLKRSVTFRGSQIVESSQEYRPPPRLVSQNLYFFLFFFLYPEYYWDLAKPYTQKKIHEGKLITFGVICQPKSQSY